MCLSTEIAYYHFGPTQLLAHHVQTNDTAVPLQLVQQLKRMIAQCCKMLAETFRHA